jgi:hypothetical protein
MADEVEVVNITIASRLAQRFKQHAALFPFALQIVNNYRKLRLRKFSF